jgi:hypothetical protein
MDLDATIDLIIKDLREAEEIIEDLGKYPGIPVLQVELARLKCRSAGEVIALLKTMKSSEPVVVPESSPGKVAPAPAPVSAIKAGPPAEQKEETTSGENIPPVRTEKKTDAVTEEKQVRPEPQTPKRQAVKKPESSILADRFSHLSGSFNEQLGRINDKEDISNIMKTKPVRSLNEAIGINDKFFFIREIFNGDHDDYSQALSRLENVKDLADARAVIMSFTGDDNLTDAIKQLLDLVKRKLPSNE